MRYPSRRTIVIIWICLGTRRFIWCRTNIRMLRLAFINVLVSIITRIISPLSDEKFSRSLSIAPMSTNAFSFRRYTSRNEPSDSDDLKSFRPAGPWLTKNQSKVYPCPYLCCFHYYLVVKLSPNSNMSEFLVGCHPSEMIYLA